MKKNSEVKSSPYLKVKATNLTISFSFVKIESHKNAAERPVRPEL